MYSKSIGEIIVAELVQFADRVRGSEEIASLPAMDVVILPAATGGHIGVRINRLMAKDRRGRSHSLVCGLVSLLVSVTAQ